MDFFQDTLDDYETGNVIGHAAPIACNYKQDEIADDKAQADEGEVFENPSLSMAGVMGWLTGSQDKPICGEKLKVLVYFDHDCLKNKPGQTICFPVLSACARSTTFPVQHLKSEDSFRQIFTIAYSKGQSFGRPRAKFM